jgi:putative membrane protein
MRTISILLAVLFYVLSLKPAFAMTDSEALNLISTIDRNEIQAADLAASKASDPKVLEYAGMLKEMHTRNLQDTEKIAVRAALALPETPAVKDLADQGSQDLAALQPLSGRQFEVAYITAMIQGHTDALDIIDNQLMNSVEDIAVKKHLDRTRQEVDEHLQAAKKLQSEM